MFERSLVESRGLLVSETQKWTALGSLTLQCALVGLLLSIPLLRPDVLPLVGVVPQLTVPFVPKPPVVPPQVRMTTASSSTAISAPAGPAAAVGTQEFHFPRPGAMDDGPAPAFDPNLRMGGGPAGLGVIATIGPGTGTGVPVVRARPTGPVVVSGGVEAGMLLAPIQPVYQAIARAAGVQGAVMLEAVISKAGRIESLHVVSGPPLLQRAARDAVEAARYAPYKLSGQAVDVQTTITVVFKLGAGY